MEERKMSRHLEKRGPQDDWCKESPLEMLPTQDKTQNESSQNHSCRVSLLYHIQCVQYMKQDTLFLYRECLREQVEGRSVICEKPSRR